jgi:HD-GYP domain-containing protein (c-di-GMP phosphodiesterase class II)
VQPIKTRPDDADTARVAASRSSIARFLAAVVPVALLLATSIGGPLAAPAWSSPRTLFVSVVVATALCAVAALVVVVVGWRRRLAEVAMLGSALLVVSLLPLVHGITTPGILYGANSATRLSVLLAVPLAVIVAAPMIWPETAASRAIARHWRAWSVAGGAIAVLTGVLLLVWPRAVTPPGVASGPALLAIVISLLGGFTLARRQLRLYAIGRRRASLIAAVGFAYLSLATLVWLGAAPYSLDFWAAHGVDATGVFAAAGGLLVAHWRDRSIAETLAPVVNRDPLVALELGLTPVVHALIAALEAKDQITRDHVVRVGEMAMRLGLRAGIAPRGLRTLGLAALLHDVGKLTTPDAVLTKPGPLDDEEFALMREHTTRGEELLLAWPTLAAAAPLVRSHHERPDGTGYPDGLDATRIPLPSAIISVCDAWDAMTYSRQYRAAMDAGRARQILAQYSGTQWDAHAVALLLAELSEGGPIVQPVYNHLGHNTSPVADVCPDALPSPKTGANLRPAA